MKVFRVLAKIFFNQSQSFQQRNEMVKSKLVHKPSNLLIVELTLYYTCNYITMHVTIQWNVFSEHIDEMLFTQ